MGKIDMFIRIFIGVILFLSSIKDIKSRQISMTLMILGMVVLFMCIPFRGDLSMIDGLLGTAVGFIMIGIGKLTRWKIGMGDGIVLILTGMGVGFWENIVTLLYSLFIIFIFTVILLLMKKITSKTTLPFVPFLFLGYLGMILSKNPAI